MRKIIALAVLFVIYSANAQKSDEKLVYSLQSCIETALEKNFSIRIKDYQLDAANADMKQAFGSYLPNVGFNFGYDRQLNAQPGYVFFDSIAGKYYTLGGQKPNQFSMSLGANLPLFDGFYREANYSRARLNLRSLDLKTKFTIEFVKNSIYKSFLEVIRNSQIVRIGKENFARGQKDLERFKAEFDAGVRAKTDVYTQEADQGNLEIAIVNAQNALDVAKSNIMIAMGLNPNISAEFIESSVPTEVSEQFINETKTKVGSMNSAVERSLKTRNDYLAAGLTLEASQTQIDAASSAYYPSVTARGGWSWNHTEFNSFKEQGRSYIGIGISVPIFDNFSTDYRIQNAKLQVAQSEFDRLNLEQNIRSQVQTAFIYVQAAEKQMEISKRTLFAAQMNYESFKEKFEVGAANITDVTTANAKYISAQIDNINYIYLYLEARKELLYSTGIYE